MNKLDKYQHKLTKYQNRLKYLQTTNKDSSAGAGIFRSKQPLQVIIHLPDNHKTKIYFINSSDGIDTIADLKLFINL